jgi:hypothetical protein
MTVYLFLITSACVTNTSPPKRTELEVSCEALCESQSSGFNCESVLSSSDCSNQCLNYIQFVPDNCDGEAKSYWDCLSELAWECTDGSLPESNENTCELEKNDYFYCGQTVDTAG